MIWGNHLRRVRQRGCAAAVLALGALGVMPVSHAHETAPEVVTTVASVDPLVEGLEVSVVRSVTVQLVMTNNTGQTVEVIDDDGRAFLRLRDGRVEANVDVAAAWTTNDPLGQVQPPASALDGVVRDDWRPVAEGSSWGWFDHRLHPDALVIPPEVGSSTDPVALGEWAVPLRVGDLDVVVSGSVEFQPPSGNYRTQFTVTPDALAASVLDGPAPGVFADLRATVPVVVLGRDGEAMLRFSPDLVEANLASPTWHDVARAMSTIEVPGVTADAGADPRWSPVAQTARFGWIEPRAAYPVSPPDDPTVATTIARWSLPVLVGDDRFEIGGQTSWVPAVIASAETPNDPSGGLEPRTLAIITAVATLATVVVLLVIRRNVDGADLHLTHAERSGPTPGPPS